MKILNLSAIGEDLSSGRDRTAIFENTNLNRPVNINKASCRDLENVSGIGGVIARRIIDYRNQFGSFEDLEDLKKVKGIGDKKIEVIKEQITFR